MPNRDNDAGHPAPKTDDVTEISKLHGLDRSGMGDKGWAEVPSDRIGGHPELESAPDPESGGGINGPQPDKDRSTGGAKSEKRSARPKPRD